MDQDTLEEFLADRLLNFGETPGQAVLSAVDFHEELSPLAICFALVTVAADLRLYGSKELTQMSENCFETAALLACDIHASAPLTESPSARSHLLKHWGSSDMVFNRAKRAETT